MPSVFRHSGRMELAVPALRPDWRSRATLTGRHEYPTRLWTIARLVCYLEQLHDLLNSIDYTALVALSIALLAPADWRHCSKNSIAAAKGFTKRVFFC